MQRLFWGAKEGGKQLIRKYATKSEFKPLQTPSTLFSETDILKERELERIRQRVEQSGILNGNPPISVNDLSEKALRSWDEVLNTKREFYSKAYKGF